MPRQILVLIKIYIISSAKSQNCTPFAMLSSTPEAERTLLIEQIVGYMEGFDGLRPPMIVEKETRLHFPPTNRQKNQA